MTMPEHMETQEPDSASQRVPEYVIDPLLVSQSGRSLSLLLQSRRCASCNARLEASQEMPSDEDSIREIAKCCSTQEGFISPEMPMQEIVFRTILSEGNRPVSLERLHYAVTEGWYSPINPRSITLSGLKRVLDSDAYYGFKEVEGTSEEG